MYRQLSKQLLGKGEEMLGNELSAPYEIPQFPIEQIQSKLQRVRTDGSKLTKEGSLDLSNSINGAVVDTDGHDE